MTVFFIILWTSSNYAITTVQYIFITEDLQATIILFTRKLSLHKTDLILSAAVACSFLSFILQGELSDECTWRRISLSLRNLYKCKQIVYVTVVCVYVPVELLLAVYFFIPCSIVVAYLLVYPFFWFYLLITRRLQIIFLLYICELSNFDHALGVGPQKELGNPTHNPH